MSMWYYTRDGQQNGPISEVELKGLVASGRLPDTSLVWAEGMTDWQPISSIHALAPAPAPADAPADASVNPYAAPSSGYETFTASAPIDLPDVQPTNFGLFATLYTIGVLAVVAGYGLIFSSAFSSKGDASMDDGIMTGGVVVAIGFVPLMISGIMSLIYLHRAWTLLQPHTHYSTPGKAVGFLFIPFYNFYWIFVAYWRWAQEWNRLVASNPNHHAAPRVSEGLFLAYSILNVAGAILGILAFLPLVIVFLLVMKTICNVVNYAAVQNRPA